MTVYWEKINVRYDDVYFELKLDVFRRQLNQRILSNLKNSITSRLLISPKNPFAREKNNTSSSKVQFV